MCISPPHLTQGSKNDGDTRAVMNLTCISHNVELTCQPIFRCTINSVNMGLRIPPRQYPRILTIQLTGCGISKAAAEAKAEAEAKAASEKAAAEKAAAEKAAADAKIAKAQAEAKAASEKAAAEKAAAANAAADAKVAIRTLRFLYVCSSNPHLLGVSNQGRPSVNPGSDKP